MRVSEVTISYKHALPPSERPKITGSKDSYDILLNDCFEAGSLDHREKIVALFTDRSNRVISWITLGIGGIDATVADVRIVLQAALLCNASGIILSHNHPSGNTQPSESDKKMTAKVNAAAKLFDLRLLDHVIITSFDYYSFADAGQI